MTPFSSPPSSTTKRTSRQNFFKKLKTSHPNLRCLSGGVLSNYPTTGNTSAALGQKLKQKHISCHKEKAKQNCLPVESRKPWPLEWRSNALANGLKENPWQANISLSFVTRRFCTWLGPVTLYFVASLSSKTWIWYIGNRTAVHNYRIISWVKY